MASMTPAWALEGSFPGGGAKWIFPKVFPGDKRGEICFLPLEIKETSFLLIISKTMEGKAHGHLGLITGI